jgi:hypothetical protein
MSQSFSGAIEFVLSLDRRLATGTLELGITRSIAMTMREREKELQAQREITTGDHPAIIVQGQPVKRLEFRHWDEAWDRLAREINQSRLAHGLLPATDAELSAEIQARRAPEKLEALERAIQKGIDSLGKVSQNQVGSSLTR